MKTPHDIAKEHSGKVRFINIYLISHLYGGPEEGGWYYDSGDLQYCIPIPSESGRDILEEMQIWCDKQNEGTHNRYSVIGTPDWYVELSTEPGRSYPEKRPHYE